MSRLELIAYTVIATLVCTADNHSSLEEEVATLKDSIAAIKNSTQELIKKSEMDKRRTEELKKEIEKQINRRIALGQEIEELKSKAEEQRRELTVPCGEEEFALILEARINIIFALPFLMSHGDSMCEAYSDCPDDPAFWVKFISELANATIFCPVISGPENSDTLGRVVDFPEGNAPGSFAVFNPSLVDGCDLEDTIVHEVTHLASGNKHEHLGNHDDWTYYIGRQAALKCWQRRHERGK